MRIVLAFAAAVASATFCLAQSSPPPCLPASIDIHALPLIDRLLVLEAQNIGPVPCYLTNPTVSLLPKLSALDELRGAFDNSEYLPGGPNWGATLLSAGDWVHMLIAWQSEAAPEIECVEHSALKVWLSNRNPNISAAENDVTAEIYNLHLRSCGEPYVSDYRRGHYSPDSRVPAKWLDRGMQRREVDYVLPLEFTWLRIDRHSPLLKVEFPVPRTMLSDDLYIRLRFPRDADHGCPFRLVRMRESQGRTVISLQNCPTGSDAKFPVPPHQEPGILRLDPGGIGLLPQHSGSVDYEIVSPEGGSLAQAHFTVHASDPTMPAQAPVANPLPACDGSQLRITAAAAFQPKESRKALRAYEATNISARSCALAGVPILHWVGEKNIRFPFFFPHPCPNCPNDLFEPRPNGRIDLSTGQSAHVLLGATAIASNTDPGMRYSTEPSVAIAVTPETEPVVLPFEAGDCAALDISAWRAGAFDGDPKNVRWSKAHEAGFPVPPPVPANCNKPGLLTTGSPRFISVNAALAFGLSAPAAPFVYGEKVLLHLWVNNSSDQPANVMTCMDLDFFKSRGFDLYDAYGHRVLSHNETRLLERCKTNPNGADFEASIWQCFQNFGIPIPAQTCRTGDDYDFTLDLTSRYDLPPGDYILRFRDDWRTFHRSCNSGEDPPFHPQPNDVRFSIVQP